MNFFPFSPFGFVASKARVMLRDKFDLGTGFHWDLVETVKPGVHQRDVATKRPRQRVGRTSDDREAFGKPCERPLPAFRVRVSGQ